MKNRSINAVTPQRKIISNTEKFKNSGIKKQQGTTRVLYDTLPLDGRTVFNFFEESNNRNFPRTNTGADGNRLGVGNALAIERAYFSIVNFDPDTDDVLLVSALSGFGIAPLEVGELSCEIANSQVLKQVSNLSFDPRFNKNASYDDYNNFEFDTQLVLNPLLEYVFKFRVPNYTPSPGAELRLTIEGVGAIIAPRNTF